VSFVRRHWVQLLILVLPFALTAALWPALPERVPIHWNAAGEVDGYAPKALGTLFLPVVNVALVLALGWLIRYDPRLKKASPEARRSTLAIYAVTILHISGFLCYISLLALMAAVGCRMDVGFFTSLGVLFLLLMLGNMLGKLAPNYLIGIRTPWTLESRNVWRKTHRLGGRLMVLGALLGFGFLFLLPGAYFLYGYFVPYLLALAVGCCVYSWWQYKEEQAG